MSTSPNQPFEPAESQASVPPPPPQGTIPPQAAHYGQAPAQLSPETEKQIGALAHGVGAAATFFSGGTLGFVAALVMYFIYRDRGPFVRSHVANALNVQIMIGIGLIISALLMIILVGFITYPIVWTAGFGGASARPSASATSASSARSRSSCHEGRAARTSSSVSTRTRPT